MFINDFQTLKLCAKYIKQGLYRERNLVNNFVEVDQRKKKVPNKCYLELTDKLTSTAKKGNLQYRL